MLAPLKATGDIWKFRMRMAIAVRDAVPGTAATADELNRLVAIQAAYWERRPPLSGAAAHRALLELNDRSTSAFVFSIHDKNVRVWNKRKFPFPIEDAIRLRNEQRSFLRRAMLYQAYIQTVVNQSKPQYSIDFAVDVNDIPESSAELPIFGFQKKRDAHNMLLPDVDFFHGKWYRQDNDPIRYEEKTNSACFVGSSTGAWLDAEGIRNPVTPRLRAAAYFHGNPRILFKISKAVQCMSQEATAHLVNQPYFTSYVGWQDQLRHRFLISLDGNGAACSRLVKGLLSNSAVIKFDSPYELYYFPALRPGRDYIRAEKEEDVERIIESEAASPGTFRDIAESGQLFAAKYLTITSVMDYTVRLLTAFSVLTRR